MKLAFAIIGLSFVGLLVATYITVKISLEGHEKIVDPAYYEKGLNYEKTTEANRKMIAAGYTIVFENGELPAVHAGDNLIRVYFRQNEKNIENAEVTMKAERGATYKYDQIVKMKPEGTGLYSANIQLPANGNWIFTFRAGVDGKFLEKSFQLDSR